MDLETTEARRQSRCGDRCRSAAEPWPIQPAPTGNKFCFEELPPNASPSEFTAKVVPRLEVSRRDSCVFEGPANWRGGGSRRKTNLVPQAGSGATDNGSEPRERTTKVGLKFFRSCSFYFSCDSAKARSIRVLLGGEASPGYRAKSRSFSNRLQERIAHRPIPSARAVRRDSSPKLTPWLEDR